MSDSVFTEGSPPGSVCLVRLSSIGDVTHALPIVNTIRSHWPQTQITWIIGKTELELVRDLPGIEFVVFDKRRGVRAYLDLRRRLRGRRFDALLLMQLSLRANLASLFVRAPLRIGFDRRRAKDLHGLFVNRRIEEQTDPHVLDGFFGFTRALGITDRRLVWDLCCSTDDQAFAERMLPAAPARALLISPCGSHPRRNWPAERYAEIADYAVQSCAMRVVLTGGASEVERDYGRRITAAMQTEPVNLIGKTTLRQLTALIERADIVISPDSGPAHIATCVGKPVIGLYAASNPDRTAPYLSRQWCVNRYPQAVRRYLGKDWREVRWGAKVKHPAAMELITVADVRERLARWLDVPGVAD